MGSPCADFRKAFRVRVTASFDNAPLTDVLGRLAAQLGALYERDGQIIRLHPRSAIGG
jgi:hypothetical protein